MEIILDMQGFKKPINEFIVKEVAAIKIQRYEGGYEVVGCVLFKPPCEWDILPAKYKSQNLWCERNYHGIPWHIGDVPYDDLKQMFNIILENVTCIYVKGLEKKKWIANIIDNSKPIINMEDLGCPALGQLNVKACWHHNYHDKVLNYNCAFENVQRLKKWFLENLFDTPSLAKSLQIFYELKSLKYMRPEDIACLSKDFILLFAWQDIDDVWDKLPVEMQRDTYIMNYQRCRKHCLTLNAQDVFDGPIPLKKNCPECFPFVTNTVGMPE